MRKRIAQCWRAAAIAIVLSSLALVAIPMAAQNINGHSATVVAHLPLPGPPATQMLLQKQGSRLYLYVDQGGKEGVAVVDVTSLNRPSVVNHVAWPGRVANGELQPLGPGMALSESPEAARTPQTVSVLDMADPAHPQVLDTFSGVTSTLPDSARNLIFIANADGLWIVRTRVGQRAYAVRHRCTSEGALTPDPDCY
ncbi:MAG: hypothetical protein WA188_09740 [Terriglobales bacterium]